MGVITSVNQKLLCIAKGSLTIGNCPTIRSIIEHCRIEVLYISHQILGISELGILVVYTRYRIDIKEVLWIIMSQVVATGTTMKDSSETHPGVFYHLW